MIVTAGGSVSLRGTTAAARPELAGVVEQDRLRSFGAGGGTINGVLQERIVRSSVDGTLAFYYRIKELTGGSIRRHIAFFEWPATLRAVDMDYRVDGLGEVGPFVGSAATPMRFDFDTVRPATGVTPTMLSRFMFIKMVTGLGHPVVTGWDEGGRLLIVDTDWNAHFANCFRPIA
jgi:hypothetical protein